MLEYLVVSRARRQLLQALWVAGRSGSVSILARACGLSFGAAHRELEAMAAAGLAIAERKGATVEYRPDRRHPKAKLLIALLVPSDPPAPPTDAGSRSPESAIVDALVASHGDEDVAVGLPALLWRQRDELDCRRLREEATRRNERQALGLFLTLAGALGGDRRLRLHASFLRDRRRTAARPFFSTSAGAPRGRPLPLALRWGYLMPIDLARFQGTFTPPRRRSGRSTAC